MNTRTVISIGAIAASVLVGAYIIIGDMKPRKESEQVRIIEPPEPVSVEQYAKQSHDIKPQMNEKEERLKDLSHQLATLSYNAEIAEQQKKISLAAIDVDKARAELKEISRQSTMDPMGATSFSMPQELLNRIDSLGNRIATSSPESTDSRSGMENDEIRPEEHVLVNKFNPDGTAIITVMGRSQLVKKGSSLNGVNVVAINPGDRSVTVKGIKSGKQSTALLNTRTSRVYAKIQPLVKDESESVNNDMNMSFPEDL